MKYDIIYVLTDEETDYIVERHQGEGGWIFDNNLDRLEDVFVFTKEELDKRDLRVLKLTIVIEELCKEYERNKLGDGMIAEAKEILADFLANQ